MIRIERCEGVCAACETSTGSRTLRPVVRLIVASPSGGAGGAHNLCPIHAAQFAPAMAQVTADAACSCCGRGRRATFRLAFKPRTVDVCQALCGKRMHELLVAALAERDGWAADWDPAYEPPLWWGAAQANASGRRS